MQKKKPKAHDQYDEEKLFDIHDAVGLFRCDCTVCLRQVKGKMQNTIHKIPERLQTSLGIMGRDKYY